MRTISRKRTRREAGETKALVLQEPRGPRGKWSLETQGVVGNQARGVGGACGFRAETFCFDGDACEMAKREHSLLLLSRRSCFSA